MEQILILYKEGKTLQEVAYIVEKHRSTIWRICKKAGIIRSSSEYRKGLKLSKEHRKNISKGLNSSEKKIGSPRRELKVGYDQITPELAYISGVLMGDGYLTIDGIGLEVIDKEFADKFSECVELQFGLKPNIYYYQKKSLKDWRNGKIYQRKPTYTVRKRSILLHNYISKIYNLDFVDKLSDNLKIDWLRGLWDSDGSVNKTSGQILFYNKNINIIKIYQEILKDVLDIESKYYLKNMIALIYVIFHIEMLKSFLKLLNQL